VKFGAAFLTVACLAAAFSLAAAAGAPRSYTGRSAAATAVLEVMPRGVGRLRLRFTAAGAAVRREARSAQRLEAFCLWTIPGVDEGLGLGTTPIARPLLRSGAVRIEVSVSFRYVPRYTCGLHVYRAGEEPSGAYLRGALLSVRLEPAH
jgi:hypothetical protein